MRCAQRLALVASIYASAAIGQVQPMPGDGDPHLRTVEYHAGQIVHLRGAPGYQLMVELSPDEVVQSVALGDSGTWQVSVNKTGDRLFLKPAQGDVSTNMTVVTSVRVYTFDLVALSEFAPDMPYTVQFRYPAQRAVATESQFGEASNKARQTSRYKISGDRQLRPMLVTNDGERTYIKWPATSPIPAIYVLDRPGNEALVNGMMGTDDAFVVDGVPQRLIFRIDRNIARAERIDRRRGG